MRGVRSVYEQPEAKVDGIAPCKGGIPSKWKKTERGTDKGISKGSKKGNCAMICNLTIYVRVYNNRVNAANKRMCLGYK